VITQQELAQWRAVANWSDDNQVEQDFLISQAVAAIFQDKFLSGQVAMRGGTVLHKAHLAPATRYSEDIDLVLVGDRPAEHIELALTRVLMPLLGEPKESVYTTVKLAVRNVFSRSTIIRKTYAFDPINPSATFGELKVECNTNETKSHFPLTKVQVQYPDQNAVVQSVEVVSYDLDEMLGTKMRALLQREHGRDLYDIVWAWERSQQPGAVSVVSPARVGDAFRFYMAQEGSKFTAQQFRQELERRMSSVKFLNDMKGLVPPGHMYSPQQAFQTLLMITEN
jgi:predicted nucleotidyltransferase component of viral defense system